MARILYVEDNDDNIYMLQNRLKRQGFDVLVARDGASGVEMARSERPGLVLLDLGLSGLDVWLWRRLVRAEPRTCYIRGVVLAANARAGGRA